MGFRALLMGVERKSDWYDGQPVDLGAPYGLVPRREVYPLYTDDLDHAVRLWKDFRRFGLPHGGGSAGECEEYMALIRAFENEYETVLSMVKERTGGGAGAH